VLDIGNPTVPAGLRPLSCKPVRIAQVFDDPDAVMARFRQLAPVPSIAAFLGLDPSVALSAWFRCDLADELFFNNPVFVTAAREAFSAEIVRPTRCRLNLYGPMAAAPAPHLDAAAYRGLSVENAPIWLIYNMSASGLFEPWLAPVASGLAWFWRGEGGEFEFWPGGEHKVLHAPLWNTGLVCDNEYTWHRVGGIASEAARQRLAGRMSVTDKLHADEGGGWDIRDGEHTVGRLGPDEVRISVLWKADVFRDVDHLASFSDPSLNLDVGKVTEIYLEDLDARGLRPERPADPLADPEWRRLLDEAYTPPFATG
jgi:hypothetical protein